MSKERAKSEKVRRRQRSIFQIHYGLEKKEAELQVLPLFYNISHGRMDNLVVKKYESQVAGHLPGKNKGNLCLLKSNYGTVLKPIIKPEVQKREIDFYEYLETTSNADLKELKRFVPRYYGTKRVTYNGHEDEYIALEELAKDLIEPSIMDVKVGRQTWDPLASQEKIRNEQSKYVESKASLGFCIPGFQVYKLCTGRLHKYGKEYGKKLTREAVIEALRTYLNIQGKKICRNLILQLLTELWKIRNWASKQMSVKLYAASLLFVYDTKRLRDCCGHDDLLSNQMTEQCKVTHGTRRNSVHSMQSVENSGIAGSNFSGQLTQHGPKYKTIRSAPTTPLSVLQNTFSNDNTDINTSWHTALTTLKRSHSFHHNYDQNLSKMKMDYNSLLKDLVHENDSYKPWATVKIIDFAHAFFTEGENTKDTNFLEGIDNLVKIYEEFLHESEMQIEVTKI